eukprot:352575-Amphidinium_carterae.1
MPCFKSYFTLILSLDDRQLIKNDCTLPNTWRLCHILLKQSLIEVVTCLVKSSCEPPTAPTITKRLSDQVNADGTTQRDGAAARVLATPRVRSSIRGQPEGLSLRMGVQCGSAINSHGEPG